MCLAVLLVTPAYALKAGDDAPVFFLRDAHGNGFNLSDYVGPSKKKDAKGVIIAFFASWCGPCRKELPVLNSLTDEFDKKGVKTVIIGVGEDFDKITEMLSGLKVDRPIILSDKYKKVSDKYGVIRIPMTVLIGSDGRVKFIIPGEIERLDKLLREKVEKLLQ